MKKWLFGLLILSSSSFLHAELFESVEDRSYLVRYNLSVAAATSSTSTIVISLPTTATWPHREVGELDINTIRIDLDKVATSTAVIRLGVVTAINTSTGSVKWFYSYSAGLNVSNNSPVTPAPGMDNLYRLRVNPVVNGEGTTPFILSNEKTLGSTTYQSDVVLPSPVGVTAPSLGDLVMDVSKDAVNVVNIKIEVKYFSRRR